MKLKILISILSLAASFSFGQDNNKTWEKINFLIGNWQGEGSGKPGEGSGYFSFNYDLDSNIVVRKSHSEYPAAKDKPLILHDDLLIVYPGDSVNTYKANYFDNEGHVIYYRIAFPNRNEVVFTSVKTGNVPVFRLTYKEIDKDIVNTKFEMSRDGENFFTYVEGKSKKQTP